MKSIIESLLFIAHRPLTKKELVEFTNGSIDQVENALEILINEYMENDRGVKIIQSGNEFQMVTDPKNSMVIAKFLKREISSDLTPASLETLSIIAYRGPVKRSELEQIRGVNCSIILRNLLIKGLVITQDKEEQIYNISIDFIKHLGINDLKELPDYDRLNQKIPLSSLMEQNI